MGGCCSAEGQQNVKNNNNKLDNVTATDSESTTKNSNGNNKKPGRFGNRNNNNEPFNNSNNNNNGNGKKNGKDNNNNNGPQQQQKSNSGLSSPSPPQKKKVEFFLESVVPSFCEFVKARTTSAAAIAVKQEVGNDNNNTEVTSNDENKIQQHQQQRNQKLLKIFVKTLANFVHSTQHTPLEEARRLIKSLHDDFSDPNLSGNVADEHVEERCADEGLTRCLETWYQNNTSNLPFVDRDSAVQMTKELEIDDAVCIANTSSNANITFGNIVSWYYESSCLPTTLAVYEKLVRDATTLVQALYSNNNNNNNNGTDETGSNASSTATPPPNGNGTSSSSVVDCAIVQLLLTDGRQKESQTNSYGIVDQSTAKDFLHRHFGGTIVEENFCTFIQSHKSNSVFEAKSVSSVWQDMTQPLPNYLISCQSIHSEKQMNRAISDNVRAFLIKLDFVPTNVTVTDPQTGQQQQVVEELIFVDDNNNNTNTNSSTEENKQQNQNNSSEGRLTFQKFCEAIRDRGFKKSSFPIIICFPPWETTSILTRSREERIARILNDTLGPMLAKGLMFRGATIRDPEFSPATLRHKVLLMSSQAKLNPFIGLFVADMARTLGVRVTDVKELSPAASAGVTGGDWITRVNQETIEDKKHLRKCLASFKIGEEFTVTRENLSQARIVVGAAVDKEDPAHASDFSSLLFFNFNVPHAYGGASTGVLSLGASYAVTPSASPHMLHLSQSQKHHHHHVPASVFDGALNQTTNGHNNSNNGSNNNGKQTSNGNTKNGSTLVLEAENSGMKTAPPTPSSPIQPNAGGGGDANTPLKTSISSSSPISHYAPWETAIIQEGRDLSLTPKPVDHLVLMQPITTQQNNNNNNHNNKNHQNPSSSPPSVEKTPKTVKPLSTDSLESNGSSQKGGSMSANRIDEETLMDVQEYGAQLVDSLGSRAASQWSRGTFVVNGHCGYVLRDSLISDRQNQQNQQQAQQVFNSGNNNSRLGFQYEWTFKLITLPVQFTGAVVKKVEATVFGHSSSPAVAAKELKNLDEEDVEEGEDGDVDFTQQGGGGRGDENKKNETDSNKNSSPPSSPITQTMNAITSPARTNANDRTKTIQTYSPGTTQSKCGSSLSVWIARIRATQQARIALSVDFEDGRRIEAVLPAHLLRTGPRAVPFRIVDFENKKFPTGPSIDVLCSVARKELK